jgi:hypothetical protein
VRAMKGKPMVEDTDTCACGHVADEHGHDPSYPGSSACLLCGCVAFECTEDHDKSGRPCPRQAPVK